MLPWPPQRFDGSLSELHQYSMVLIDTSAWSNHFKQNSHFIHQDLMIRADETEDALGWCITESVVRAYPKVRVLNHYLVDKFRIIYDHLFYQNHHMLMQNMLMGPFSQYKSGRCLRVLPMIDKTIIAIGI